MNLVIGGYAQGKLKYVLEKYSDRDTVVWDGRLPQQDASKEKTVILNHFHLWVRQRIAENGCPEDEILLFLENCPNCVIISDEIGNGIVPVDAFERTYRERTGRILVQLAGQAEEVERVICGIGQKIK